MTWPFENNTNGIVKNLAKRNLKSEKRRNIMVVVAVALAAFLVCLSSLTASSLTKMKKDRIVDTYEATYVRVSEENLEKLKNGVYSNSACTTKVKVGTLTTGTNGVSNPISVNEGTYYRSTI